MQVIAEEWSLDVLAELARGFVSGERDDADAVALGAPPLSVIPRPGDDEVGVLRIVLLRVAENLPRTPGIFLVPESGNIEIGNGGGVKLAHPGFFFPEVVVVGMVDARIPVRNRSVKVLRVDVGERAEIEIPLVSVVSLEIEMGVLVLVGLLHHGVFKVVTLAQRAVAVVIVIHPLIDGRGLFAHGFQRRVRVKKSERGRQAVVGNTVHANVPVVVRHIFHQPVDRVVGVRSLVGGLGIAEVDPGGKIKHAFGFKASAKILDDEDVAVLGQLFYEDGICSGGFSGTP